MDDPNFPPHLEINPSKNNFGDSEIFGNNSQKSAIQKYGIAGRVWEAAYTLTAYLESREPWIEFDPPSPFSARRSWSWSSSLPERVYPNFNCDENGRPSPSGPNSSPDLDAKHSPSPLTILELGSGTGIIIAKLVEIINQDPKGAQTDDVLIATDLANVCPLLDENLSSATLKEPRTADHPSPRVLVRPLEWGNPDHALKISDELDFRNLTHVICSDLVYFPHLLAPLLRSLIHLTSLQPLSPQPTIIISYKIRSLPKEIPFWSAFGLWFSYEPVLYRLRRHSPPSHQGIEGGGDYESDRNPETDWARYHTPSSTYIFIARRKNISLSWSVPESDKDLLEGVGAYGDRRRKGDDTFELMMLMNMADNED